MQYQRVNKESLLAQSLFMFSKILGGRGRLVYKKVLNGYITAFSFI